MTVEIGFATTPEDIAACMEVRRQVFVIGQNVDPELDFDGLDDEAIHFIARKDGKVVGTARWIVDGPKVKFGRLSVLDEMRGQGIGTLIFDRMVEEMRTRPDLTYAKLSAQIGPMHVYRDRGFVEIGERYMEAGMEHQDMEQHFD
ncbi:GNAT family N-acetyltransferase [Pontivivens insulae]|uniref:Acetyltransferase n=1 Tax=Pontivivens insulae TaxID=1639689 RepID=A0A2R8AET5_9RHOB|nr:GNAT family N-acetyltransferase [Pontivivens insulae]RED11818.1 putative GNAT family N-acyltransferase [Pontivivens insulae]SPF30575.1 Acetyltransferase [Pontivivens insulae]